MFIGATTDNRFRGVRCADRKEVWTAKLEKNANAESDHLSGKDGKQYVAVMAGDSGGGVCAGSAIAAGVYIIRRLFYETITRLVGGAGCAGLGRYGWAGVLPKVPWLKKDLCKYMNPAITQNAADERGATWLTRFARLLPGMILLVVIGLCGQGDGAIDCGVRQGAPHGRCPTLNMFCGRLSTGC